MKVHLCIYVYGFAMIKYYGNSTYGNSTMVIILNGS